MVTLGFERVLETILFSGRYWYGFVTGETSMITVHVLELRTEFTEIEIWGGSVHTSGSL